MATRPSPVTAATAAEWAADDDVSARSLLVTIFGDSIIPVATSLWLSDLFELTEPFGFTQRLIRTSLFRLSSDDWVSSERVGRRSRYSFTPLAIRESTDAGRRIYLTEEPAWDGTWTMVMVDAPTVPVDERETMAKFLRWQGFVPFGRGVLASPTATPKAVTDLLADLGPTSPPPMAEGELHDIDRLVSGGLFTAAFAMAEIETAYRHFLDRYRPLRETATTPDPMEAFVLRTMLVHDFRRIRLREPEVPRSLLAPDWIGNDANQLAAELYHRLSPRAAVALGPVLGVDYPETLPERFGRL